MEHYKCKKSQRGPAIPSSPGGNWPSQTGNASGDNRGNAAPHK